MHKNIFYLLSCLIFLSGCAGIPIRTNPQHENYFSITKTIALMPIEVEANKITAGGVPERMDEWEEQIRSLLKQAIKKKIEIFPNINLKVLEKSDLNTNFKEFLDEENGLYRAVAQSIISHTYVPGSIFPHKLNNFDYTLGSEINYINEFVETDSLLFVGGERTFWTGGRIFLATWGYLLGAVTGVYAVPQSVPDWLAISLVDTKTGNIIWFKFIGQPNTQIGDLRKSEVVEQTVGLLFRDFVK